MFDKPQERTVSSAQARGVMAMLLALNLFLLSFFILLNSLAGKASEKAELAKKGVEAGFDLKKRDPVHGPDAQRGTEVPWQQNIRTNVKGIVRAILPIDTLQISANANRMVVEIPEQAVFTSEADMDARQRGGIENILTLVANQKDGQGLRLTMVMEGPEETKRVLAARGAVLASILIRKIDELPALKETVSVGVSYGKPGALPKLLLEFKPLGTEPATAARQVQKLLAPTGATVTGARVETP